MNRIQFYGTSKTKNMDWILKILQNFSNLILLKFKKDRGNYFLFSWILKLFKIYKNVGVPTFKVFGYYVVISTINTCKDITLKRSEVLQKFIMLQSRINVTFYKSVCYTEFISKLQKRPKQ